MDNRRIIKQFTDEHGEVDMVAVVRERQRLAKESRDKHRASGKTKTDIAIYNRYKRSAKDRGIEFWLYPSVFSSFLHKPCHYCGTPDCIGVDRRDSKGSYTVENMVPCCGLCNRMKMAIGEIEFINQCKRIADHKK